MATTVTTHQSWGSRLGNSLKGIVAGLVLFVISFPILFWNEGRTVHRAKALAEGESVCADSGETPDVALDGKLVHVTAEAVSDERLADDLFPVTVTGIRLKRVVEMYQWEEDSKSTTKKNLGGSTDTTTTYTYHKRWLDHAVDSSDFQEAGHDNPDMPIDDETFEAEVVRLGGFELSDDLVHRIGGEKALAFDPGESGFTAPFPAQTAVVGGVIYLRPGAPTVTPDIPSKAPETAPKAPENAEKTPETTAAAPENAPAAPEAPAPESASAASPATPAPNFASSPEIGDVRVSFRHVPNHVVSVVAKQDGSRLGAYQTKNGPLSLLDDGTKSAEEMFASAKSANKTIAWLLRLAGFLVMLFGVRLVLGPLETLADVVPFIGRIVGFGTGLVAALVAVPCTLVTIAVAWLAYRPALGIALLVAAVAAVVLLVRRGRARAAE